MGSFWRSFLDSQSDGYHRQPDSPQRRELQETGPKSVLKMLLKMNVKVTGEWSPKCSKWRLPQTAGFLNFLPHIDLYFFKGRISRSAVLFLPRRPVATLRPRVAVTIGMDMLWNIPDMFLDCRMPTAAWQTHLAAFRAPPASLERPAGRPAAEQVPKWLQSALAKKIAPVLFKKIRVYNLY